MKGFYFIIFLVLSVGCKGQSTGHPNSKPVIPLSNFKKCTDDQVIKFYWDYCETNTSIDSRITEVCIGGLLYTDIMYPVIQTKARLDGDDQYECLIITSNWKDISPGTCMRKIEREYMTLYGDQKSVLINECSYDADYKELSFEGVSISGDHFFIRHKESL